MRKYPREAWKTHFDNLKWAQGEHMLISAPTGAGKTTMLSKLVEKRAHVVILVSKFDDPTFEKEFKNYVIMREWPKHGPKIYQKRILLWPAQKDTFAETIANQKRVFSDCFEWSLRKGNGRRCIVVDEMLWMTSPKKVNLGDQVEALFYTGRSAGITMIGLTQRPAWIPKIVYSSVTHAYIAKTRDRQDTDRLSDLGGVDNKEIARNLATLPSRHDYVYVNPLGDTQPRIVNTRK